MSISPGARPFIRIDAWNDIPRAISLMQQAGVPRYPALQALYRGRIAHLEVQRTGSTKLFKVWAAAVRLPALALIGRVLMIECSSANITTWQEAASKWAVGAQGQVLQPPPGCVHPSLEKGRMQ